jgi:lipoprotein
MKLNLLKTSALLCGLFFLGSCAQEAPQADNKTTLEDGPRVAVPIELEVSVDAFDAPKSLDQEARAYTGPRPLSRSRTGIIRC